MATYPSTARNEILNKTITISKVSEEEKRIKISDEKNLTYSIFKNKANGDMSMAYDLWMKLPNKFIQLNISYTESKGEYQGKEVTYRSIIGFKGDANMFKKDSITQPAVVAKKIETDKVLREDVKEKWEDRTADIKYGLAWNCASRIIATNPDIHNAVSVFNIADRTHALANAIFSRINYGPTDEGTKSDNLSSPKVTKKEEVKQANDFIAEMYFTYAPDPVEDEIESLKDLPF